MEIWKAIPGFPRYEASTHGRIRSLYCRGFLRRAPLVMRLGVSNGYLLVVLVVEGVRKTQWVHRLILLTFVGPCPEGMEARHSPDRTRANCRLDNLSWGTKLANAHDQQVDGTQSRGSRHGRHTKPDRSARGDRHGSRTKPGSMKRGEAHHFSKLSDRERAAVRAHRGFLSIAHLSWLFDLNYSSVWKIHRADAMKIPEVAPVVAQAASAHA